MRKAWLIVALVVVGIALGSVGVALAQDTSAPQLAPPLEGQNLCRIVGKVTGIGESSITVEGVKVKRVVEDGSFRVDRIKGTFTVMVTDETQYRLPPEREPSLEGVYEGDRVVIVAEEDGELIAQRVIVVPQGLRVKPVRHALLLWHPDKDAIAVAIPSQGIVIIAEPIKVLPFRGMPFQGPFSPGAE